MADVLKKLITLLVLGLLRLSRQYKTEKDACDIQMWFVLLQEHEDEVLKPIGYWSRSTQNAESRYDTTNKEYLAVVWDVLLLRLHLEGTHFIVRTGHQAL